MINKISSTGIDFSSEGPLALISAAAGSKATVAPPEGTGLSELSTSTGLHGELKWDDGYRSAEFEEAAGEHQEPPDRPNDV